MRTVTDIPHVAATTVTVTNLIPTRSLLQLESLASSTSYIPSVVANSKPSADLL